jgi:hypothetical protein
MRRPERLYLQDILEACDATSDFYAGQTRRLSCRMNSMHATLADVEQAFACVLTSAAMYFDELWRGRDTDDTQRAVMRAIALRQDVRRSGDPEAVNVALNRLVQRDMLAKTANGYCFRVELMRRWVEQAG